MPVYMGRNSGYARRFGLYVRRLRRKGIDTLREVLGITALICWDLKEGKTVNASGHVIRMDKELFKKRLNFIRTLEDIHKAPKEVKEVTEKVLRYALRHKKPPKAVKVHDRKLSTKAVLKKVLHPIDDEGKKLKERIIRWAS